MPEGKVKKVIADKGFGFIEEVFLDIHTEDFLPVSNISPSGIFGPE